MDGIKIKKAKGLNNQALTRAMQDDHALEGVSVAELQRIEQGLIPISEEDVLMGLVDERFEVIEDIHSGIVQINELFGDLAREVDKQRPGVDSIHANCEMALENTKKGCHHIKEADRIDKGSLAALFGISSNPNSSSSSSPSGGITAASNSIHRTPDRTAQGDRLSTAAPAPVKKKGFFG